MGQKGYAFNPAAFIARPKDPDNPAEALEGFFVIAADLIRSLDGPLRNTFLVGAENTEYGEKQNDYKAELRIRYHF